MNNQSKSQQQDNTQQANQSAPVRQHTIQLFRLDNAQDDPIQEPFAIACPDEHSAKMLFDTLRGILRLLTYQPKQD